MSDDKPSLEDLMERLKEFAQSLKKPDPTEGDADDSVAKLGFPALPKLSKEPLKWYVDPLRKRIDYQAVGRKSFLMDDLGFKCGKCGLFNSNKDYVHSDEECTLHGVMES